MTEEEAKKKWCPQTGALEDRGNCLGTNCMAWRELEAVCFNGKNLNEGKGYCGLVGKP